MSNASTIRRQVSGTQQLTLASLSGTTITTTATPFSLNNNALTGSGGGVIPLSAGVTGLYAGTGQVINIHIAGTAVFPALASSETTLIITLYVVPASSLPLTAAQGANSAALVTAGGVLIATGATGTASANIADGTFSLDAYVQLDAAGNLQGWFQSQTFASTTGAKTATTAAVLAAGEADLNFVAAAQLGGTETSVVVALNEFSLALV